MKYSPVINYYQTVFYHNIEGHKVADWSDSLVFQTVKGIKNSQNSLEDVKDPLDLKKN